MATIKEVMENLPNIFKPGKAKGWNRVILFDLGGEEPSKWTLTIKDGAASVEEGETTKPRLIITGNSEHIVQMFTGEGPPRKLVNTRKVTMKGPLMDSIACSGWWDLPTKG